MCSSTDLAYTVYSSTGDQPKVLTRVIIHLLLSYLLLPQVMYCLIRQGRIRSGLSYAEKMKLSVKGNCTSLVYIVHVCVSYLLYFCLDYAVVLNSYPSKSLAQVMVQPPAPHTSKLTLFMVTLIVTFPEI